MSWIMRTPTARFEHREVEPRRELVPAVTMDGGAATFGLGLAKSTRNYSSMRSCISRTGGHDAWRNDIAKAATAKTATHLDLLRRHQGDGPGHSSSIGAAAEAAERSGPSASWRDTRERLGPERPRTAPTIGPGTYNTDAALSATRGARGAGVAFARKSPALSRHSARTKAKSAKAAAAAEDTAAAAKRGPGAYAAEKVLDRLARRSGTPSIAKGPLRFDGETKWSHHSLGPYVGPWSDVSSSWGQATQGALLDPEHGAPRPEAPPQAPLNLDVGSKEGLSTRAINSKLTYAAAFKSSQRQPLERHLGPPQTPAHLGPGTFDHMFLEDMGVEGTSDEWRPSTAFKAPKRTDDVELYGKKWDSLRPRYKLGATARKAQRIVSNVPYRAGPPCVKAAPKVYATARRLSGRAAWRQQQLDKSRRTLSSANLLMEAL